MEFFNEYDFVIIGEHPAGLWLARQLLRMEQRILVLPLGANSGVNALPRKVLSDFQWDESRWPDRHRDPIQVLVPGHRFRLVPGADAVAEEYRFHYGQDPAGVASADQDLIRGLQYLIRGRECSLPASIDAVASIFQQAADTLYHDGPEGGVIQELLGRLRELGAHVASPRQLRRVFLDRKHFVGVQLIGNSRMVAARNAIVAGPMDLVRSMMSEEFSLNSTPTGWNFDIRVDCSPEVIPEGLGTRMIFVAGKAPVMEILRESAGRFRLRVQLPLQEIYLARDEQRRVGERMLAVCQSMIPDLEYNLRGLFPDLRDPERAETVELPRMFPFEDLSRIPPERLTYGDSPGLSVETPVPNLFVVGDESFPGAGIHGSFDAAKRVLEALAKKEQRQEYSHLISP